MRRLLENQTLLESIKIKTFTGNYRLAVNCLSKYDVCEQNGELYIYLEAINIYLPIRKSECK